MNTSNFKANGFDYHVDVDIHKEDIKFSLTHNKKVPRFLYKYYSMSYYSVDALLNNYLYASHPFLLNDKYDCSPDLIDLSNCTLEELITISEPFRASFSIDEISDLYNSPVRDVIVRDIAHAETNRLFLKFGIISLTESPCDILMWAYYAQNRGFVVKLDIEKFKEKLFGPFPINYSESLEKIDYSMHNAAEALFYQSNVKDIRWKQESEWRYLKYMKNGLHDPIRGGGEAKVRSHHYDQSALMEIILGYDLFHPRMIKRHRDFDIFNITNKHTDHKLIRKVFDFAVKRNIKTKQVVRDTKSFKFGLREIFITKLGSNKFRLEYGEIDECEQE